MTYRTSGDMEFRDGRWQPMASAIPPFVPSGPDPVGGAGTVLTDRKIRDAMRAELEKQGLPLPPHLQGAELAEHKGGQHELLTEGGESGAADPSSDERIEELEHPPELERKGDTDRPPPRRGRPR